MKNLNKDLIQILHEAAELLITNENQFACNAMRIACEDIFAYDERKNTLLKWFEFYFKPAPHETVYWYDDTCPDLTPSQRQEARILAVLFLAEIIKTETLHNLSS